VSDAFQKFITQYPDFVKLRKLRHATDGTFYINPNVSNTNSGTFHEAVKANPTNTSYTIELKIQVKDVADLISDSEFVTAGGTSTGYILSHEIRPQFFGLKTDFYIIYDNAAPNEDMPWGISTTRLASGIVKRYPESFKDDPHVYSVVYNNPSVASPYSVSVDGEEVISKNSSGTFNSNGNNILVIGANSADLCNMDVYYVKMKKTDAATWDILEKYMDGMAITKGGSISSGASITKNTDAVAGIDYMNIKKEGNIADNGRAFYLNTIASSSRTTNVYYNQIGTGKIVDGEAYTIEVKARIPQGSTATAESQIGLRLFDKIMSIVLSDGKVAAAQVKSGYPGIEADPGQTATDIVTSDWHNYRIIFKSDEASYDVFVDNNPLFLDVPALSPTGSEGANLIKLGTESWAECDMDIASVKMGTGAFSPVPTAISPVFGSNVIYPSTVGKGGKLTVNAENANELSVEIIDISGKIISKTKIAGQSGDIQAPAIPGLYFVKVNQVGTAKIVVK
jgi:hypothetical protein